MERTTPLQQSLRTLRRVQRYLSTARQYRWLLAAILALVWGAGLVAAYGEFTSTYESTATVWVLRVSPDLAQMSPDDPNIRVIKVAPAQAEYWDSPGTALSNVKMAVALVTGMHLDPGEHRKASLGRRTS